MRDFGLNQGDKSTISGVDLPNLQFKLVLIESQQPLGESTSVTQFSAQAEQVTHRRGLPSEILGETVVEMNSVAVTV